MLLQVLYTLLITTLITVVSLFAIKFIFTGTKSFKDIRSIFKNRINTQKEIKIEEVLFLDNKRKIILIQYKNNKYLLLIGSEKDIVIEKFQE